MLAQSFKSAADLGLSEPQLSALQKTLVLLETGKLKHVGVPNDDFPHGQEFTGHFNMGRWNSSADCGTVCCIGGTAVLIGDVTFEDRPKALQRLFYPLEIYSYHRCMADITVDEAATALRSYLTTGDARWDLAIA